MSFNSDMTNLANAIRTKAGVTGGLTVSAMTTAVNGIVINTGSDIDLSGVNVTADKLLSGIVAVNADGEKVTGNIATVTPSISANVFTVRKGYVAQDAELTVPEAAVTETDSSVTIGVGYVSEELTYDLGSGGSDIDFTGVNVTANNLLEGIVAIGHDGGKVTGRMNYSTPRRDGSSVIVPLGYVDRQYTFEQMQVGYDTSEVTASFDNMLQGTIAIGPAGERIEGGIPTLTTANIDLHNGAVIVLGPGYISDDGVAGLRYELPESTVTTTDTTLTATVGYLKEPINFTASGTGGGGSGSGAFDLAKVTEYTPYAPEITATTEIEVSGMGIFGAEEPDYAEDYTAANGTYLVTADTAGETDWKKRVYKHESADYYLYHYADPDYPEDAYWVFGENLDYWFLSLYSSEDIASGENDWHNEDWGEDFTLTLDVTTTTTPETPMVLKGVLATGYTDGEWSFADSEQNFTGFEKTPKPSFIYTVSGNNLIGNAVAYDIVVPAGTVFLFNKTLTDVIGGIPVTNYGLTASDTGIICGDKKRAEIPAGTLPPDVMCDDKPWTLEIRFRCGDTTSWQYKSPFGRDASPRFDVTVTKNSIYIGGSNIPAINAPINDANWHIYKVTHTSANVVTTYLDDMVSNSATMSGYNMREYTLWIGDDGSSLYAESFEIGHIRIGNTVEV